MRHASTAETSATVEQSPKPESIPGWDDIRRGYRALMNAAEAGDPVVEPWNAFERVASASAASPPLHLAVLLDQIVSYTAGKPRPSIRILDHGCGGGLSLLYLAGLGFKDIWGADIGDTRPALNRITREALGHQEDRFLGYDGETLPLPDKSVDVIFSQQVLEHVTDALLDAYYKEEARILKSAGWALHQVPHRLVPYDSHTRTWFLHWLPRPVHRVIGNAIRRPLPDYLFLRWPWQHKRRLVATLGHCEDLTLQRLTRASSLDGYHGSVRLRRLIGGVLTLPLIGPFTRAVLPHLVMLETRSVRR